jgi:hypothetical protein
MGVHTPRSPTFIGCGLRYGMARSLIERRWWRRGGPEAMFPRKVGVTASASGCTPPVRGVMLEGYDAGVSFRTVYDPDSDTTHTVMANWSNGAWPITRSLDQQLLGW